MISTMEVRRAVEAHLARCPHERHALADALRMLEGQPEVTRRTSMPGHVTVGALLLDGDGHVLVVGHRAFGIPLQPGGHVEETDQSLPDAALRELAEECGIDPGLVTLFDETPAYIEYGPVPARPDKGEPRHFHLDIGFFFTSPTRPPTRAQVEEVTSVAWQPIDGIENVLPGPVAYALANHAWGRAR